MLPAIIASADVTRTRAGPNVSAAEVIAADSVIGAPDNQASSCTFGVAMSAIGIRSRAIADATSSGT